MDNEINNNNNASGGESPAPGIQTPERFRINPVQSRRVSLANAVTFLEEDANKMETKHVS